MVIMVGESEVYTAALNATITSRRSKLWPSDKWKDYFYMPKSTGVLVGGGGGGLPPNKIKPWLIFNVPTKYWKK